MYSSWTSRSWLPPLPRLNHLDMPSMDMPPPPPRPRSFCIKSNNLAIVGGDQADESAAIPISLTPAQHPSDIRNFEVKHGEGVIIGRASATRNDHKAAHDNALFDCAVVSRQHAELAVHPYKEPRDQITITDRESMHGTFVNDRRLPPHKPHPLRTGDEIKLGSPVTRGADTVEPVSLFFKRYDTNTPPPTNMSISKNTFAVPSDDDDYSDMHSDDGSVVEVQVTSSAQTTPEQAPVKLGSQEKPIEITDKAYKEMVIIDGDSDDEETPVQPARFRQYQSYVKDTYDDADEQEDRVIEEDFVGSEHGAGEHDAEHLSDSDVSELSHHSDEADAVEEDDEQPEVMSSKRQASLELGEPTHITASHNESIAATLSGSAHAQSDIYSTAPAYQPPAPFDPVRSSVPGAAPVAPPIYPSTTTAFHPRSDDWSYLPHFYAHNPFGSTMNSPTRGRNDNFTWQAPSTSSLPTERRPFASSQQASCFSATPRNHPLASHVLPASSFSSQQLRVDNKGFGGLPLGYSLEEPTASASTGSMRANVPMTSMPAPSQQPWAAAAAAAAAATPLHPEPTPAATAVQISYGAAAAADELPQSPRPLKRKAGDLSSAPVVPVAPHKEKKKADDDLILIDPTSIQAQEIPAPDLQHLFSPLNPTNTDVDLAPVSDLEEEVALRPAKRTRITVVDPQVVPIRKKEDAARRRREIGRKVLGAVGTVAKYTAVAAAGGVGMVAFLSSEWAGQMVG